MNYKKLTLSILLIFAFQILSAQIIGGRDSGQMAPKEASASELNPGAYSGNVNLFSGTYSSSYPLGTVSTPTGLSHTVSLNYSGTFAGGDNVPHVSGIPYGEGWNVSIPSISISTEDFSKYTLNQMKAFKGACNNTPPADCTNRPMFEIDPNTTNWTSQEIQDEGSLYWFAPQLSIPGVASGRLVFKCEDDNEAIFVLQTFEDYIEARFDGKHWRVILSSGIVYEFRHAQISDRNASNQRLDKDLHKNKQNIAASVLPKSNISTWYVSKILNPNLPGDQIKFRYKTYGKFNFYKEYLQYRLGHWILKDLMLADHPDCYYIYETEDTQQTCEDPDCDTPECNDPDCDYPYDHLEYLVCNGDTLSAVIDGDTTQNIVQIWQENPFIVGPFTGALFNPKIERFNVYRDIFLQEVTAHSGFIMTEKLDLEYETLDVNHGDVNNMLLLSDPDVYSRDDLYNYKTVYHQGIQPLLPGKYNPNSTPDDFSSDWQRYRHFATWEDEAVVQSPTNPFVGKESDNDCNSKLYYKREGAKIGNSPTIPFDHSFLESGQIIHDENNNVFPSGELYEIRTLIHTPAGKESFCNFDINIVTGEGVNDIPVSYKCPQTPETNISESHYKRSRGQNIFSTFNQSIKWNAAGNLITQSPEHLYTSNFFSMPNIPSFYNGFYIQVGPGNSDHVFNMSPESFQGWSVCPVGNAPLNYHTYTYELDNAGSTPYSATAPMPNNFGIGQPWYLVHKLYDKLDDSEEYCAPDEARYRFWWNYQDAPIEMWDNKPTLADDRFSLQNVELVRYSKNPYMLRRVKHYKVNGIVDNVHTEGLILVKSFELDYSVEKSETYDARSDNNTGDFIKLAQHDRNIFFLKKITELPTDPTGEGLGGVTTENPTTHFEYDKLTNQFFHTHYRSNANVHALSKIINPLGGVTEITYYEMDESCFTTKYQYLSDRISWNDPDLDKAFELQRSRPNVMQIYPRVLSKSLCSGSNGESKTWTYDYYNRTSRNNFPDLDDRFERDIQLDVEMGFTQVIVTEPALSGGSSPKTKYLHYGFTLENNGNENQLFGKLKKSETYTPSGFKLQETNYNYSATKAYNNMMFTKTFLHGAENKYYKKMTYPNPEIPSSQINVKGLNTDYQLGTTKIKFYETHFAAELHEDNTDYMHSFFVKLKGQTTTHYDPDGSGLSYQTSSNNTYFEASPSGVPNSSYNEFLDNGKLAYDPSWQPYKTSTKSDNAAGTTSTKRFYYYDLLNVYGAEGDFDALWNVYQLGRRDLVYEERTTKSTGGGSVENTSYYVYDSDWNKVRDIADPITIPVDTTDLTPCNYSFEEPPAGPCVGVPITERCCQPIAFFGGEDPPFGWYQAGGKHCRPPLGEFESAFNADIAALTDAVNDNNSSPGGKLYNLDDPLWQSLFLRKIHVKISDTPQNSASITLFAGQDYAPVFPYENWKAYEVLKRNRFGQVSLEENERGLHTAYEYQKYQPIQYEYIGGNENKYNCYNYEVTNQFDIGVPKSMTVGHQLEDSLHYTYAYHPNYAVKSITDPNGLTMEYQYDEFGRLYQVKRAGNLISKHEYHQWQNDTTLLFDERTAQNWVKSEIFHEEEESVTSMAYLDPLGRKKGTLSAATDGAGLALSQAIIAENVEYDNWDRVLKSQKPTNANGNLTSPPTLITGSYAEMEYENDQRGRVLKSYNYDGTYVTHTYQMINGIQVMEELELNVNEQQELIEMNNPERFVVLKTQTTDEDNKVLIEYSNIFGQKIATKQLIGGQSGYAITLFIYDGHGNVRKVINPKKQVSTYTYNKMNWLTSKTSIDGGTYTYYHNASGQVRVAVEPIDTRVFEYDIFGRMIQQDRFDRPPQLTYNSIIIPDDEPIQGNFIPEKKWYYHGHLYPDASTYHSQVVDFIEDIANEKGRLTFSVSYSHDGNPNHYNLYTYHIEGYLKGEIKQFERNEITADFKGKPYSIAYSLYNLQGSLKRTGTYVDGQGMGYEYDYDEWNRLSEVQLNLLPHYFEFKIASYQYDNPTGLLLQTTYYNSSTEFDLQNTPSTACTDVMIDNLIYNYDGRDRLTGISSTLMDYNLYYGNNQPTEMSGSQNFNGNINASRTHYKFSNSLAVGAPQHYIDNPTLTYGYTYDGLNRLTNAITPYGDLDGTASYAYDKIGNLTSLSRTDPVDLKFPDYPPSPDAYTYHYEQGTNKLEYIESPNGNRNFTYDGAGNLKTTFGKSTKSNPNISFESMTTQNGRANLPYEVQMQEVILQGPDPNSGQNMNYNINYEYDTNDQRVYKKVVRGQETTKEYYVIDATGRTLAIDDMDSGVDWYVYGRERIAKFQTREGDSNVSWETPESFHFPNNYIPHVFPTYYIHDHLGNTRITYRNQFECDGDGQGGMVVQYDLQHLHDYFPYGKTLREWSTTGDGGEEHYLTTHHQRDFETNFDHRGARLYDADVGRFLSLDPLAADFPSWSDYNYVLGNPIIFVDPNGKSPDKPETATFNLYIEVETPDGAVSTHEQNVSFTFNEESRNWEFNSDASNRTGNGTDDTEDGAASLSVKVTESNINSKKGESHFTINIDVNVTPEQEITNNRETNGSSNTSGSGDEGSGGWGPVGYTRKQNRSNTTSSSNFKGGSVTNSKSWNYSMSLNCSSICEKGTISLHTSSDSPNTVTSRGGYTLRTNLNGQSYNGMRGMGGRGKLTNSPMTRGDGLPVSSVKMR